MKKNSWLICILILLPFIQCSGSNQYKNKIEDNFKIYFPTFRLLNDKEILKFEGSNNDTFYVLTDIYPDTFSNKSNFKKINSERFKLTIDRIYNLIAIGAYKNLGYTRDSIIIWSHDTVRVPKVPIYKADNLFGRYVKIK